MTSQSGTKRSFEDHGTEAEGFFELECEVHGCWHSPDYRIHGHLHFSLNGEEYSADRLSVCKKHEVVIKRSVRSSTTRGDDL